MRWKHNRLLTIVLAAALVLGSTVSVVGAADSKTAMFDRIRTVYNIVNQWHKDGADAEKFTAGAIKGGLEALGDPYTNYFSKEEYQSFLEDLNGSFSGVGAYLEQQENYVVISAPIKGSPAAAAGIMSGDRILEANGTPLIGATTDKAAKLIRGTAGTAVTLKIERPSEKRTFTLTIVRAQITIPEVDTKMLDTEIGYLQISTFGDDAAESFYKGIDDLKRQGAKAFVLDLRQNGGGYLDAAVSIASAFLPKDEPVVWEVGKGEKSSLNSSGRPIDLPVTVLVDKGTASASEILAGALQDYKVGPLVGVTTFGKGTVQQILSLNDGGGIKVTVAEYLTGKQRHVHHIGLTPDYVVEMPPVDQERTAPMELKRPILMNTVGLDVLYLQYRLQDLGYSVDTDGHFGLSTLDAATQFAQGNQLPTDPLITEQFITVLNEKVIAHARNAKQADPQLDKALELARAELHK